MHPSSMKYHLLLCYRRKNPFDKFNINILSKFSNQFSAILSESSEAWGILQTKKVYFIKVFFRFFYSFFTFGAVHSLVQFRSPALDAVCVSQVGALRLAVTVGGLERNNFLVLPYVNK